MVLDENVDRNFKSRLVAEEGPQILEWVLSGAQDWVREGLPHPEAIQTATADYLTTEDVIGDWLTDCTDQEGEARKTDAYANFKTWMQKQGHEHAWSPQAWWSALEDRGYTIHRTSSDRFIRGLGVKAGANL